MIAELHAKNSLSESRHIQHRIEIPFKSSPIRLKHRDNFHAMNPQRIEARKICAELQRAAQLDSLLPAVINMMSSADLAVKKMCYTTFVRHAHKAPREAVLAVNTLLMDSRSSSPAVRALVYQSLVFLSDDVMCGSKNKLLIEGLRDVSAFSKRHAVIAFLGEVLSHEATNKLVALAADPDPFVSSYALSELADVSSLNTNLISRVLNNISVYGDIALCQVISVVSSYTPTSPGQLLDILSILDPFLDSVNISIVSVTMDSFLHFASLVESHISKDIHDRLSRSCLPFLRTSDTRRQYMILLWLQENCGQAPEQLNYALFQSDFQVFLAKQSDPDYLKLLKMSFLPYLISTDSVSCIMENFTEIAEHVNEQVLCAIASIIEQIQDLYWEECCAALKKLFTHKSTKVLLGMLPHVLKCKQAIQPIFCELTFNLLPHWNRMSEEKVILLLHLAASSACENTESLAYIDQIAHHSFTSKVTTVVLKCATLDTLYHCFLQQPAEYMDLLKYCITQASETEDTLLQNEAIYYASKLMSLSQSST